MNIHLAEVPARTRLKQKDLLACKARLKEQGNGTLFVSGSIEK
jgi:hypothetical protein